MEFEDTWRNSPLGPQPMHIERLLAFSETATAESVVLVHCEAGISRSTAAGIIILAQYLGAGRESLATSLVMDSVALAAPNVRMVKLADRALRRGGALMDAVDVAMPNFLPFF